jgi:hypothetical protein
LPGHMRRQQKVRQCPQPMVTRQRLLFVHIQRCVISPAASAVTKSSNLVVIPRPIDEKRHRFHATERARSKKALSRRKISRLQTEGRRGNLRVLRLIEKCTTGRSARS